MNYQAFTNDSLVMMYEAIRGALAADDAHETRRADSRFRVRETPEWKKHAADLEVEMLNRGIQFKWIDCNAGQETLLFDRDLGRHHRLEAAREPRPHPGAVGQ